MPVMKHSIAAATLMALAATGAAKLNPHASCCPALAAEKSLQGKVLSPDSAAYDARLKTYYSANAAQHAWCMVLPESTKDAQTVMKIVNEQQCPFGIRAGAHSAWKGSNGIKDGITIDLGNMNSTTYNEDTTVVSIQSGAKWGSVYETLNQYNVTVVGARTSVVGVGGFTTGGGYTFHSNTHGFACDMVANWEIVLANGTVVNANEKENADLWKAQKGGSGNLGLVTRIDQYTVPGTQLWGGFTDYALAERDNVFHAYLNFVNNAQPNSPNQNIVALFYDPEPTGYSLRSILTNNKGVANASEFDEYLAIPNLSTSLASGPESEIIPQFTGPTPLGLYANWFTGMAKNTFEALAVIDELHREYVPKMQAAAPNSKFNTLIEFQPLTEAMVSHSAERGGNVLGLEPIVADAPALMWLVSLTVDTEDNQKLILPIGQEFIAAINQKQKDMGTFIDWIYLNYAWADEDPYSHYGHDNLALLRHTSHKYDPKGAFLKLRQTGFKFNRGKPCKTRND